MNERIDFGDDAMLEQKPTEDMLRAANGGPMKAWHFVGDTLRDGRPVPADGVKLIHDGQLVMCESGLHFSPHPFDALIYAPGDTLCLVEVGGTVVHGKGEDKDKGICSERTIIVRMDAEPLLRQFARQQALSVVHLWNAPHVVLDYLMGDDAAWDAARDAAWTAAWDAARDAALAAARDELAALVHEAFEDWL
jgi:hypothetical protein